MRPADLAVISRVRADLRSGAAFEARAAAGVSAAEFAAAVGVSRQAVRAWETGRSVPSAAHALAYGKLLASLARPAALGHETVNLAARYLGIAVSSSNG